MSRGLGDVYKRQLGDNRIADDFTIPAGETWDIQSITLFSHEYMGPQFKNSRLTSAHLRIWDGPPNVLGSNVIWGELTTNVLVSSEWTGIYRLLDTDSGQDDTRGIMANLCQVGTTLGGGTYWFEWRAEASFAYDGPYAPPITEIGETTTGNGLWYWTSEWQDAVDIGQQGFPFAIEGSRIDPVVAPDQLHVGNVEHTEIYFYCEDSFKPPLTIYEDYGLWWRNVFYGLQGSQGFQYQGYPWGSCTGTSPFDFEIPAPDSEWAGVQFTPTGIGTACYRVRSWETTASKEYSSWSPCCCMNVVDAVCTILGPPVVTQIGDTTCGGTTSDSNPILRWQDVANDRGYRWEVRDTSENLVVEDTTASNVSIATIGTLGEGSYGARVQARGDGEDFCDSDWSSTCSFTVVSDVEESIDFTWWPEVPKQGERVRFADLSTGILESWLWDFGDSATSNEQHPTHVFTNTGTFTTELDVAFASGHLSVGKTISVMGAVSCGNGACESGETAWSCPADCALEPEETGRAGGSDRRPTVPAAAGAVSGVNNTMWNTEATIYNPGPGAVKIVVEYTPMGQTEIQQAGPFDLPEGQSLYWSNMVQELFKVTGSGALWIDATGPVLVVTRTYTSETSTKAGPGQGTYGQGFPGARERLTLSRGAGEIYLIGLRDDNQFRTNLYFQEVDGLSVKVKVALFADSGEKLDQKTVLIDGHSVKLKNLGSLFQRSIKSGYVTAEVMGGEGRIAVAGSVIDEITGDPTSIGGIHPRQVLTKADGDTHDLVAAVVHTKGLHESVWRSKLTIQNPATNPTQIARLVYRPEYDRTGAIGAEMETTVTLKPGQQVSVNDVLPDLFGAPENVKTQGSLHVYSTTGLLIDSRTYNERADGGTLGLGIPALQENDLIDTDGGVGLMAGLKHSQATRTNVGLAEYSGMDTVVTLTISTTRAGVFDFPPLTRKVSANSHLQIPKIFEKLPPEFVDLDLKGLRIQVDVESGGSIYAYATVIDNASGDPTTFLTVSD